MYLLTQDLYFPPVAKTHPSGIVALGGDLSVPRLLLAYHNGIFPWYEDGEAITWWSPDTRMVVIPSTYVVPKKVRASLKNHNFTYTQNRAFAQVITHCSTVKRSSQSGTWITDEMREAYLELHHQGYASSIEVWQDQTLVGGLYGVDLGTVFCGESMFSLVSNASKFAFTTLVDLLHQKDYKLLDCQVYNDYLSQLGAFEIPRPLFMAILERSLPARQ